MSHGGKGARRRYMEKKGFIKPRESLFSKSEEGIRYQYNDRIANKFAGWSSKIRDTGRIPTFTGFYNELPKEDQNQITVTEIFKSTQ